MVKVLLPLDFFEKSHKQLSIIFAFSYKIGPLTFFSNDDTSLNMLFCKRSKSNTNKMFCLDLDCNFNFLLNAVHIIVAIYIRLIHIRSTKKECGRTNRCFVLFFPVSVMADNCWQYWRLTLPITPKHRYWLGWPNFVKAAFLLTQKKLFCIFMLPSNDIYISVDIDKSELNWMV